MVTAINFDNAVMVFGVWYENRRAEHYDDGRPVYTHEQLLDIHDPAILGARNAEQFEALKAMFGGN